MNAAVEANRNQFMSTYHMLKKLVEVCPEEVWKEYQYGVPFWYQVYHCVFFIDYWMRTDYNGKFLTLSKVGEGIPPEFEREIRKEEMITKEDMTVYLNLLEDKLQLFFDTLKEEDLGNAIVSGADEFTYTDILVSQNRHVMYNIGYLNGILRARNLEESDWWSYNEA